MRAIFCEETFDITYLLSRKEVLGLRRTKDVTPVLEAQAKGLIFHLMNSGNSVSVEVKEPREGNPHYWTKISDEAYENLIRTGECGDRYADPSKVTIRIDEELTQ